MELVSVLAGVIIGVFGFIGIILISVANDEREATRRRKMELTAETERAYRKRIEFSSMEEKKEIVRQALMAFESRNHDQGAKMMEKDSRNTVSEVKSIHRPDCINHPSNRKEKAEIMMNPAKFFGIGRHEEAKKAEAMFDGLMNRMMQKHSGVDIGEGKDETRFVEISGKELFELITGQHDESSETSKGKTVRNSRQGNANPRAAKKTNRTKTAKKGSRKASKK